MYIVNFKPSSCDKSGQTLSKDQNRDTFRLSKPKTISFFYSWKKETARKEANCIICNNKTNLKTERKNNSLNLTKRSKKKLQYKYRLKFKKSTKSQVQKLMSEVQ